MEDFLIADVHDAQFREIVSAIKQELRPKRLFFFGSRAHGVGRPDSNYDFVAVIDGPSKQIDGLIKGKELTRHLPVSADLFVYSEAELEEWKDEFNSIPEVALTTGREINL